MKKKLLHTPEGVRDIYGSEYAKKLNLQSMLLDKLHLYGYQDIQTPTFEFFDIFSSRIGTIPSKELYKFFDKEGNTLVLRPDFTPSIARAAAKYFMDEKRPLRFSYMGNTFINASDFQGRLKETTQIGAELINDGSVEADAEMISLVISCMKQAGLHDFQISIGNVEFFKGLCAEYGINDDAETELREFISNKNYFGTQEILDALAIPEQSKEIVLKISEMFGSIETIKEAKNYVSNTRSILAIERLEAIYELLFKEGVSDYVTFDLGMLSKYHYYTGVIFRAYTYGNGDAVIKGGRYDNLLREFGKSATAIGFAIVVDQLLSTLSRQGIQSAEEKETFLVLYKDNEKELAYKKAGEYREHGKRIILMHISEQETIADFDEYANTFHYKLLIVQNM